MNMLTIICIFPESLIWCYSFIFFSLDLLLEEPSFCVITTSIVIFIHYHIILFYCTILFYITSFYPILYSHYHIHIINQLVSISSYISYSKTYKYALNCIGNKLINLLPFNWNICLHLLAIGLLNSNRSHYCYLTQACYTRNPIYL